MFDVCAVFYEKIEKGEEEQRPNACYQRGLSYGVDDQSLKDVFSGFGDVVDVFANTRSNEIKYCIFDEFNSLSGVYQKIFVNCKDVSDRALVYYRLLQYNVSVAKSVVNPPKQVVLVFVDTHSNEIKYHIFDEFNSLSVVYQKFQVPDQRSGKVEVHYLHDYAGIVMVDCKPNRQLLWCYRN
ncbi:hypothetical protein JHK86_004014 [Glycine max]|nr:hypothetical protein JHK86_004014 [Glycine max]